MSFAVIQMVSQSDVLANLAQARRLLEQAAGRGARLAVLPENFAAMGRRDIADIGRAEAMGQGPILPWLKQAARRATRCQGQCLLIVDQRRWRAGRAIRQTAPV